MVAVYEINDDGLEGHGLAPFWNYIARKASRIEAG